MLAELSGYGYNVCECGSVTPKPLTRLITWLFNTIILVRQQNVKPCVTPSSHLTLDTRHTI